MFDFLPELIEKVVTLGGREPLQVARFMTIMFICAYLTGRISRTLMRYGIKRTVVIYGFSAYEAYKGSSGMKEQLDEIKKKIRAGMVPEEMRKIKSNTELPIEGMDPKLLLNQLQEWSKLEMAKWDGRHKVVSGAVYHGGQDLQKFMNDAYGLFSLSNPLHPDLFPYVRKMESEVVAMSVSYFGGDPYKQCGLMTSGGTESIVIAIRAYKNWARHHKGIYMPELVLPVTAHAAFLKGCEMFEITPIIIPVNSKTYMVEPEVVKKHITKNTIAIVGSAPSYPQGTIDPIAALSKIAIENEIGLHVDCCLGSFLLPTLKRLEYPIPEFDFTLPGVTSISADTHKYGYSVKGTSVVLFRDTQLRKHAYFFATEWPGGIYATNTLAGSRPGGLIAATWAGMMIVGEKGYRDAADQIMTAVKTMRKAIEETKGIALMGDPKMSVLAIESKDPDINIFHVSAAMSHRGWSLNNCQIPDCTHICVTVNNMRKAEKFAKDIAEAVLEVKTYPTKYKESDSAIYGSLVQVPSGMKDDVMALYLDAITEL